MQNSLAANAPGVLLTSVTTSVLLPSVTLNFLVERCEIICVSVNDPFVMNAWEKDQNSKGKVTLLADGNGDFTEALGLSFDGSGFGLGKRGQRFVMIIDNGTVSHLAIEEAGSFEVSSAESVLKALN